MIIGVDHVLVAVENVEQASETYRRLGFEVQAGGEHPSMGTHNALVPLSDGAYLELIGVRDPALARHFSNGQLVLAALGRENRLATFALETNDINADVQALRWRGLEIGDPVLGDRMRPDGQKVAWQTAHFSNPTLPFLIQDTTPHHIRVTPPTQGLGMQSFLSEVLIRAADVADSSRVWKNLLGKIPEQDDLFQLERTRIRLMGAEEQAAGLSAISVAVANLGRAEDVFKKSGIQFERQGSSVKLKSTETAGIQLILTSSS